MHFPKDKIFPYIHEVQYEAITEQVLQKLCYESQVRHFVSEMFLAELYFPSGHCDLH